MELVTYRFAGHSISDSGNTYRTRDEVQHMRHTKDPINGLKDKILHKGLSTEEELKAIEKNIREEIDSAVSEAIAASDPNLGELYTDIYAKGTEPDYIRGVTAEIGHRFR